MNQTVKVSKVQEYDTTYPPSWTYQEGWHGGKHTYQKLRIEAVNISGTQEGGTATYLLKGSVDAEVRRIKMKLVTMQLPNWAMMCQYTKYHGYLCI